MSWDADVIAMTGVGQRAWERVLTHFDGDRDAILAALPEELAEVPTVGTRTAKEIYDALHSIATSPLASTNGTSDALPPDLAEFLGSSPHFEGFSTGALTHDVAAESADAEHLLLLAIAAYVANHATASLADIFTSDVITAARGRGLGDALGQTPASQALTDRVAILLGVNFSVLIDLFYESNERARDLLNLRIFPQGKPETLESLGQCYGVTRERVRQIQKRLESELTPFTEQVAMAAPRVVSMLGLVADPHEARDGLTALLCDLPRDVRSMVVSAILSAAYIEDDGHLLAHSLDARLEEPLEAAIASTRHHVVGEAESDKISRLLNGAIELVGWCRIPAGPFAGRVLDKSSKVARIGAGLWLLGEPATKEQIAEAAGYDHADTSTISSSLGNVPDVVRADIDKWGYIEWVDDVYDGIAGEIIQRIEEAGGAARLTDVIADILDTFTVSESSVRSYAMSDQFVVRDGVISLQDAASLHVATDANNVDGAVRTEHGWAQPVTVEQRHLEGFSFVLNKKVAAANGIRPEDSLLLPLHGTDHEVSVIWRLTALNGIDVGRVGPPLSDLGCSPGSIIYVCPTPEGVWLLPPTAAEVVSARSSRDPDLGLHNLNHYEGLL